MNQNLNTGGGFLRILGIVYLVKVLRQRREQRRERRRLGGVDGPGAG
jgi:hypothetical protein